GLYHAARGTARDHGDGAAAAAIERLRIRGDVVAAAVDAVADRTLARFDVARVRPLAAQVHARDGALLLRRHPSAFAAIERPLLAADAVAVAVQTRPAGALVGLGRARDLRARRATQPERARSDDDEDEAQRDQRGDRAAIAA